jgi:hypothetical protein
MENDLPLVQVEVTAKFQRKVRILAKTYRHISRDIQPVIEQLQAGDLPGDQIEQE